MDTVLRPSPSVSPVCALAWTAGALIALSQLAGCAPVMGGQLLLPNPPPDLAQKVRSDYKEHKQLYHLVYAMHERNQKVKPAFCTSPKHPATPLQAQQDWVYSVTICRAKRPVSFAYLENDQFSSRYLQNHRAELDKRLRRIAINELLPPPPVIPETP